MAYEGVVGQREGLSSLDISKIGRMYGCPVVGEFRIVWERVGLGAVGGGWVDCWRREGRACCPSDRMSVCTLMGI